MSEQQGNKREALGEIDRDRAGKKVCIEQVREVSEPMKEEKREENEEEDQEWPTTYDIALAQYTLHRLVVERADESKIQKAMAQFQAISDHILEGEKVRDDERVVKRPSGRELSPDSLHSVVEFFVDALVQKTMPDMSEVRRAALYQIYKLKSPFEKLLQS